MIHVCSLAALPETVRLTGASHVLTIMANVEQVQRPETIRPENHLRVSVDDITEQLAGFVAPCEEHVTQVLDFVRGWDRAAPLVIHCYAGISRSTASAFAAACALNPHRDELQIAQAIRAASPIASPNRLIVSLAVLLFKFVLLLWENVVHLPTAKESDIILGVLSLIDVCLTGNLVLIVVFSGYENFVSRIDPGGHPDWPEWMTKVDFAGLKQKLLASIVAISAIQLLKAFMNLDAGYDSVKLAWLVGVHMTFVVSTVMLALSDRWSGGH